MDWMELVSQIFELCVLPLLGVLTMFAVQFIRTKTQEIAVKNDNEILNKYLGMVSNTITECVIATNQTYVEALKKQGKFDAEAQKVAFNLTYSAVMTILSEDAKEYLTIAYGDLTAYITTQIEASVNLNK